MTAAAFQATFTDWRLVKGRKVVQLVFETPIEAADQAYQVLGGMPDPGQSVWCAIARLNSERTVVPDTERCSDHDKTLPASKPEPSARAKSWVDMTMAQQAGMLSGDEAFQRFIGEKYLDCASTNEDGAARMIRSICKVVSRKDIRPGTVAGTLWRDLVSDFRAWQRAPEVVP